MSINGFRSGGTRFVMERASRAALRVASAFGLLLVISQVAVAQPQVEASSDPDLVADQAMMLKLAGYIDCINDHSNWVTKSRQRYFSWLTSPEQGPTGKEELVYGLYTLQDNRRCREAVQRAASLPPVDAALEQAAANFVQTLMAAEAVVKEADSYYSLEDYKDDRMQKGKTLHPRLVAAYAGFEAASDALYEQVVGLQDAIAERRLQRLAQDPAQRDEFLIEQLMMRAKQAVDRAHGIGEKSFAREPFALAVDELERAWREFDAFRQANLDHPHTAYRHSTFGTAAFDLLKSTKAARRREAAGFTFDDGEKILIEARAAQLVDGHPVQLIEKYNGFISAANSARR
jgi:hypothetical protein